MLPADYSMSAAHTAQQLIGHGMNQTNWSVQLLELCTYLLYSSYIRNGMNKQKISPFSKLLNCALISLRTVMNKRNQFVPTPTWIVDISFIKVAQVME